MGKPRTRSFRWVLQTTVFCMALPLIALLIVNSVYSIRAFNLKLAESNQRTVDTCVWQIDDQLCAVDDTLSAIAASSLDFRTLSNGARPLSAHLASYSLYQQLKPVVASYTAVQAVFIYSRTSGSERDIFTEDFSYQQKLGIRAYIRKAVQEDSYSSGMGWRWVMIDGAAYLLCFYGGNGTYLCALSPLDNLTGAAEWELDREAVVSFTTLNNQPLTQQDFIEANNIDLKGSYNGYFLSGSPEKYMIIGRQLQNANCMLVFLVGGTGYLDALDPVQITLLALSLLTVLLIPALLMGLNRQIVAPMEKMKQTMIRIREGDLDAQAATDDQILEFQQMGEIFNTMMGQIKDLKIESYEKEIETKKAELRYYQLQIRPHFFLNGLKNLYAMAQQQDCEKIKKTIVAFSRHIRYIFRDSMEFVPLERELEHVRTYIELQALSSVHTPICRINAEKQLLEFPIPPLSLATFVENSVKHRADLDLPIEIDVKASVLKSDGEAYIDLAVSDNGPGFSEEVLREINAPFTNVYTEHHVGLNNIKRRMQLVYGDGVIYAFYNTNPGCVSEIMIPLRPQKPEPK